MDTRPIRVIAICVFRRGNAILVGEGRDHVTRQTYYRPLGGALHFGEHSLEALRREIREEIAAEIRAPRLLGTMENLFTCNGVPGHEIVQVYEAEFADPSLYEREDWSVCEDEMDWERAVWKGLADFETGLASLCPEGLLELLAQALEPDERGTL